MITEFIIKWWDEISLGFLFLNLIYQKIQALDGKNDFLTYLGKGIGWILSFTRTTITWIFTSKTTPGKLPMLFIGFFLMGLLLAGQAFAAPFLVCNPQTNVTHYVITIDGNTTEVMAFDLGDGTVMLRYDLAGIVAGTHNTEVKAKNIWGESVAVPFEFVKALPDVPVAIRIE